MDTPTPKIHQLCFRLTVLSSELTTNLQKLTRRLGYQTDECFVLNSSEENVVDRKRDKEKLKKQWKVTLKEILDTGIEYETL